jgi:D-alanyl-D-alanine carboxypeptidase (penicillin-binding protein 5/6)
MRRLLAISRLLLTFSLALLLAGILPSLSFAAIYGNDHVGTTTVNDRGMNITEAPAIESSHGILVDKDGNVLWSRTADTHAAMASITKTMTAVVALEHGNLDDVITVSSKAASVGESSAGLVTGQQVTLYDLLCGLLIHSGNDASMAIAEGIAGSESAFVDMMNAKAKEMGLSNTHFQNPHGLDADNHYSSAEDISVIIRYGMQNETFRQIVGMKTCTLTLGGTSKELMTTNALLATWDSCIGVKTGYTNKAGECLAAAASKDGVELYAVVLDSTDEVQRFIDAYKLLDWGFTHYRTYTLATSDQVLVDAPLSGFLNKTVKAGVANDVTGMVLDFNGDVSIDIRLSDVPDGIGKGETVGTITWRQGENVIAYAPLVAMETKGGPAPWTSVFTSLIRCVGIVTGDQCVAKSTVYAQTIKVEKIQSTAGQGMDGPLEMRLREYVTLYNQVAYG